MRKQDEFALDYVSGLKQALDLVPTEQVAALMQRLVDAYRGGKKVFVIGNGGSAATASHMACDLSKTILGHGPAGDRRRFRVMALTDNISLVTAWANDVCYECVFAEQLKAWADPGDLVIVITGSGNSRNVIDAVKMARTMGARTFGLLGFDGGETKDLVDEFVIVPVDNYGYVEDIHMMLDHLATAYLRSVVSDG
jgi:D-sedoheptulose 7-phosphate isomerase